MDPHSEPAALRPSRGRHEASVTQELEEEQQSLLLLPFDWDDTSAPVTLAAAVRAELAELHNADTGAGAGVRTDTRPSSVLILASDVTYEEAVVAPFLRSIVALQRELSTVTISGTAHDVAQEAGADEGAPPMSLLVLHERRSEGLQARLHAELCATAEAAGWASPQQMETAGLDVPRSEDALLLQVALC